MFCLFHSSLLLVLLWTVGCYANNIMNPSSLSQLDPKISVFIPDVVYKKLQELSDQDFKNLYQFALCKANFAEKCPSESSVNKKVVNEIAQLFAKVEEALDEDIKYYFKELAAEILFRFIELQIFQNKFDDPFNRFQNKLIQFAVKEYNDLEDGAQTILKEQFSTLTTFLEKQEILEDGTVTLSASLPIAVFIANIFLNVY